MWSWGCCTPCFCGGVPWLYVDTFTRLDDYIAFITTEHWEIGQYYFGQFFMPPWHFGFVMVWAVLPLGLTLLYWLGIVRSIKERQDGGLGWLLFLSALTPILAIAIARVWSMTMSVWSWRRFRFGRAAEAAGVSAIGVEEICSNVNAPASRGGGCIGWPGVFAAGHHHDPLIPIIYHITAKVLADYARRDEPKTETTYWCERPIAWRCRFNERAEAGDSI